MLYVKMQKIFCLSLVLELDLEELKITELDLLKNLHKKAIEVSSLEIFQKSLL